MVPFLHTKTIANLVLSTDNVLWQRTPNTKKDEWCPFPPEGVDCNTENEPVGQF